MGAILIYGPHICWECIMIMLLEELEHNIHSLKYNIADLNLQILKVHLWMKSRLRNQNACNAFIIMAILYYESK